MVSHRVGHDWSDLAAAAFIKQQIPSAFKKWFNLQTLDFHAELQQHIVEESKVQ